MQHFAPVTRPFPWLAQQSVRGVTSSGTTGPLWHVFADVKGRHFLLAIQSGAVMEISPQVLAQLQAMGNGPHEDGLGGSVAEEWRQLVAAGVFAPAPIIEREMPRLTCLNLTVCHQCNITCDYCFAGGGTYGEAPTNMDLAVAFRAVDLLLAQLPPETTGNIVFFGGEPLLAKDTVLRTIQHGRQATRGRRPDIVFDIFSNGTLLDDTIGSLLRDDPGTRLLLSLDGPPEVNDVHRRGIAPRGVAGTILGNLSHLEGVARERIVIRSTIADTEPDLVARARFLADLGFRNLVFEPAEIPAEMNLPRTHALYEAMERELSAVAQFLLERMRAGQKLSISVISEMVSKLLRNVAGTPNGRTTGCPAGRSYLAASAKGDLYPCHFLVGRDQFRLGHVRDGQFMPRDLQRDNGYEDLTKSGSEDCRSCWATSLCSGHCPSRRAVLHAGNKVERAAYCHYLRAQVLVALEVVSEAFPQGRYPYVDQWARILSTPATPRG